MIIFGLDSPIIVPIYIKIAFYLGLLASVYQMRWVQKDAKQNPDKYQKEEDPRVKSFFDVI